MTTPRATDPLRIALGVLALAALACGPAEKDGIALVGGTVISGAGDAALPDAVVIIRNGTIEAVAARADIQIPKNTEIIDVSGRWIVPGFIDGHAHVARWALDRYVAAGVTAVRDLHGVRDSILNLKEEAGLGGLVSPRIFSASAMIDGPGTAELGATEVRTVSEARRAVDDRAVAGVDYLKIGPLVTAELLKGVLDEAGTFSFRTAGHLGVLDALAAASAGLASIEHLTGVPEAASRAPASLFEAHRAGKLRGWTAFERAWAGLDSASLHRVATALAESRVVLVPTLVMHETWSRLDDPAILSHPDLSTIPRVELENWNVPALIASAGWGTDVFAAFRASRPNQDLFVREFRSAGGKLVAGTNATRPMLIPGRSLHTELELLVAAGLTPLDAIQTATHNAAQLLGADSLGMVAPGKAADLIILTANPLADIRNTRAIERVMVRGQLYLADSLRTAF
ncbi:MAG: amidohydrolase family protein [Gemmatimonadota bacterium]|nr:amidohydrolase family protein [Gemmatimonadota bacterium]MDH5282259.1 amidohydrolase family protein [Gemmatimonadota bacterium]